MRVFSVTGEMAESVNFSFNRKTSFKSETLSPQVNSWKEGGMFFKRHLLFVEGFWQDYFILKRFLFREKLQSSNKIRGQFQTREVTNRLNPIKLINLS